VALDFPAGRQLQTVPEALTLLTLPLPPWPLRDPGGPRGQQNPTHQFPQQALPAPAGLLVQLAPLAPMAPAVRSCPGCLVARETLKPLAFPQAQAGH